MSRRFLILAVLVLALAIAVITSQVPADAACIAKCQGVKLLTATPALVVVTPTATP